MLLCEVASLRSIVICILLFVILFSAISWQDFISNWPKEPQPRHSLVQNVTPQESSWISCGASLKKTSSLKTLYV